MALSFPRADLGYLSIPAAAILFLVLRGRKASGRAILGAGYGATYGLFLVYWLVYVHPAAWILITLYLAIIHALLAWFVGDLSTVRRTVFRVPVIWTAAEYLRSIGPYGYCWGLVGHTVWKVPAVIQISEITGAYGVSTMLVLLAAALASVPVISRRDRIRDYILIICPLIIAGLAVIWGSVRAAEFEVQAERTIRVELVQPCFLGNRKWDATIEEIVDDTIRVTREGLASKPDLVIWPETSIPGELVEGDPLVDAVRREVDSSGVDFLLGFFRETKMPVKHPGRNSVCLWPPGTTDVEHLEYYEKMHLVPWGEYVPWEDYFPFVGRLVTEVGGGVISGGNRWTIFAHGGAKFAVPICFESTVPDLVRKFVRGGAEFLVNVTNDAWFLQSGAQDQHRIGSVFRAVENRRAVVRAANTGRTCMILPSGRIAKEIDLYNPGTLVVDVPIVKYSTFYTRYGDLFARLNLAAACVILGVAWIRSRKKSRK